MYIYHNIEVRSCNHCFNGKAISITYSESLFVALGIQRAMCMRHTVISGLTGLTIFFPHSHTRRIFEKEVIEQKTYVLIVSTTFV
jgi:hypothetical protein